MPSLSASRRGYALIPAFALLAALGGAVALAQELHAQAEAQARATQEGSQLAAALQAADLCARTGPNLIGAAPLTAAALRTRGCAAADYRATAANRSVIGTARIGAPDWPGAAARGVAWTEGGTARDAARASAALTGARKHGLVRIWVAGAPGTDPARTEARNLITAARAAAGRPPLAAGELYATWRAIAEPPWAVTRRTGSDAEPPRLATALSLDGNALTGGGPMNGETASTTAGTVAGALQAAVAVLQDGLRPQGGLAVAGSLGAAAVAAGTLEPLAGVEADTLTAPALILGGELEVLLCNGC